MGIGIEGNSNIRMSHQVLKGLRVHSALCHIGAIGVAADMRGYFGKRRFADAVILLADTTILILS